MVARNIVRIGMNKYKLKDLFVSLVIYKECNKMHGQHNIAGRICKC